jgi:N-acylneuraminate cytidylyltransferase
MNKNKRILIVPARSGSQRLKNKNSKIFFSKPIITYSIESALKSKLFDDIIISSNDTIIRNISIKYKKKIIFDQRPNELSKNNTPLLDVINYIFENYNCKKIYNEIWILMPCAPLIDEKDLIEAAGKLKNKKAITTVTENSIPIEWSYKIKGGFLKPIFPGKMKKNSNSFGKSYQEVGVFAGWKTEYFKKNFRTKKFNFTPHILNYFKSIDIDSQRDWDIAINVFRANLHKL